jgi:hypothetical protein
MDDPAEVFARSFRLTGRLHRRQPELSNVLLRTGLASAGSVPDAGGSPPTPVALPVRESTARIVYSRPRTRWLQDG